MKIVQDRTLGILFLVLSGFPLCFAMRLAKDPDLLTFVGIYYSILFGQALITYAFELIMGYVKE